ncbi:MAG: hypothetical protein ACPGHU_00555, partial [Porticoccaceae bacterium]
PSGPPINIKGYFARSGLFYCALITNNNKAVIFIRQTAQKTKKIALKHYMQLPIFYDTFNHG